MKQQKQKQLKGSCSPTLFTNQSVIINTLIRYQETVIWSDIIADSCRGDDVVFNRGVGTLQGAGRWSLWSGFVHSAYSQRGKLLHDCPEVALRYFY